MLDRNTDTDKDETEISPERKTYEQTDNYIETDRETDIHAERERGGGRMKIERQAMRERDGERGRYDRSKSRYRVIRRDSPHFLFIW